jgi:hypothetical protein
MLLWVLQAAVPAAGDVPVRARYRNYMFGYSIKIPSGSTGYRMAVPAPQHGLAVPLEAGEIWVNGEYDALGLGNIESFAANTIEQWRRSDRVRVVRNENTTLGSLPARDILLADNRPTGSQQEIHIVLAIRPSNGGPAILYTVGMRSRGKHNRDSLRFVAIVESFRVSTLPR